MRSAKSSTQPRKAKTWCALKFKWTPVLAFKAGIACSQHAVPIPSTSKPKSSKSVPSPALQLPASHSAIADVTIKHHRCDYLPRNPTPSRQSQSELADRKRGGLYDLSARLVAMIPNSIRLATEPISRALDYSLKRWTKL